MPGEEARFHHLRTPMGSKPMTSRIMHSCGSRGVLSIDVPDDPVLGLAVVSEPSAELLDRALVGWEHFLGAAEESSDG